MTKDQRFSVDRDRYVVDHLNPDNITRGYCREDTSDEMYLRARALMARLWVLVDNFIINTNPMVKDPSGKEYQPFNESAHSVWCALLASIDASHLNTLDTASSPEHKFDGLPGRVRNGIQDYTSLSQFVDDVERLLRDIYGEFNNQAIERMVHATYVITREYIQHLQKDLWQEHSDARDIDYVCVNEPQGYGIQGLAHRRANCAAHNMALRVRAVQANPAEFSTYTVNFVNFLQSTWPPLAKPPTTDEIPF